jgi:GNAT superfamily N-acetyltransferase
MTAGLAAPYEVREAAGAADAEAARALFREYAEWLQVDLCFQGFEEELATLPGRYARPEGRLFLALCDGAPVGCAALRRLDADTGEVKRLYVQSAHRGHGLARALTEAVLDAARAIGYRRLVLDTLDRMTEARRLYAAVGFREIPAYYDNPICGTIYMELPLREGGRGRRER